MRAVSNESDNSGTIRDEQAAVTMLAFSLVSPATARTRTPDVAPNQPIETTTFAVSASFRRGCLIGTAVLFAPGERIAQARHAEQMNAQRTSAAGQLYRAC